MQALILPVVLLTFLPLSGCLNAPSIPSEIPAEISSQASKFTVFELEGCVSGGTSIDDPNSRISPNVPDGWTYDTYGEPLAMLEWLICDHVAIETIDRSNVSLLIETNVGPELPEYCAKSLNRNAGSTVQLVKGIWISDEDTRLTLKPLFGSTIEFFSISYEIAAANPSTSADISWQIGGVNAGQLSLSRGPDGFQTSTPSSALYAWTSQEGVAFWDVKIDYESDAGGVLAATGTVSSPHRNPTSTSHWNGGASNIIADVSMHYSVFEDTLCKS
jgi:hypothetical protein